jgi:hypothetical protein
MFRLLINLFALLVGLQTTIAQTITVANLSGTVCRGGSGSISYTTTGTFISGNQFTAQLSDSSGNFSATPSNIGNLSSTSSGSISINISGSISYSTLYKIRVVSTNPVTTSNTINVNLENTNSGSWVAKTVLDTTGREYAVAFNVGKNGYFGLGRLPNTNTFFRDMWQYNAERDVWTQMANYPEANPNLPVGFSIGSKGYVGVAGSSLTFYEFDPTSNAWRSRANFIGTSRSNPVAFSVGGKGYVGTGRANSSGAYLNDFYEYNSVTNTWQTVASFPGSARNFATAFTINNLGYVGLGFTGTTRERNFFSYNPSTNSWSAIAAFPGVGRQQASGFSIGSRGYAGLGFGASFLSDMYEYNPSTNSWSAAISSFATASRRNAAAFSVGNKGYIMTGASGTTSPLQKRADLWEYSSGSNKIDIPSLSSSVCAGNTFNVTFVSGCTSFNIGNVFTAELSDSLGDFSAPITIGSISGTTSGIISVTIPSLTTPAQRYQIRIKASSPETYSSGSIIAINQPLLITRTSANGTDQQSSCVNTAITPITYSVSGTATLSSSGLPSSVSANLSSGTLTISGTPTQAGVFIYVMRLTGGCNTDSVTGTLTINSNTSIVTQPLTSSRQFCISSTADRLFVAASGIGLTYQWFSSVTASNAAGTLLSGSTDSFYTPSTSSIGQLYYYCQISGTCGSPVKTNVSGLHTIRNNGSWIGNTSADWSNAANWCGGLPASSNDVVIPAGTQNSPSVSSTSANCNNLIIQSGATLTLAASQVLTVSGSIANSGTIQAAEGTLELNGTSEQTISGSLFANKTLGGLKISNPNGVVLDGTNDTLKIKNTLSFGESNCVLTTNGNLTLLSDSLQTASVADMTSDGNNTGTYSGNRIVGNVVVERYVPRHPKAWQLLAVPAVGRTIKQNWQESASAGTNPRPGYGTLIHSNLTNTSLGFDGVTRTPSCLTYRASNNTWAGIASTNLAIINPRGYYIMVRGDRSVTEFDQTTTSTKLRITGQLYQPVDNPPPTVAVTSGKLETVGNPYASALDMTKFQRVRLQDVYYIFDPNLTSGSGSSAFGGYRTLTRVGSGYIATPAETSGNSYYRNTNTNVQIQSGQAFFVVSDNTGAGSITIDESCKSTGSALVTKTPTSAPRLSINLYKKQKEKNLIDGVLLRLDAASKSLVSLTRAPKLFLGMQESLSILDRNQELSILQRSTPVGGEELVLKLNELTAGIHELELLFSDYADERMQVVLEDRLTHKIIPIEQQGIISYPFVVSVENKNSITNRFVVRFVLHEKSAPTIQAPIKNISTSSIPTWKINNNPVEGNSWNYSWQTMSTGHYRLEIFSTSGQLMHKQNIQLSTETGSGTLRLNASIPSGIYRVSLTDFQGKQITQTIRLQ